MNAAALPASFAIGVFSTTDERLFRRVLLFVVLGIMLFALVIPFIEVPPLTPVEQAKVPPRVTKFLLEKQKPPPPAPPKEIPKPKTEPLPEKKLTPAPPVDKPKPDKRKQIQEKVSQVGLLALRDQLADLRQNNPLPVFTNVDKRVSRQEATKPERKLDLTKQQAQTSGGIQATNAPQSIESTELASRKTTKVDAPTVLAAAAEQDGKSRQQMRTQEEVRLVLDRNKGSFDLLYQRQLRKDPSILGRFLFELKIDPSGRVLDVNIITSELNATALERKLVRKLKSLDFGEKNVATTIVRTWLDFSPS